MARPRAFDEGEVLERALALFWRRGFASTSIDELVGELGLSRASLYNAFGGKRELYQAALRRYREGLTAALLGELDRGGLAGVRALFESVVDTVGDGRRRGCLLTRTMVELCPRERGATEQARQFLIALEDAFERALASARASGELRASVSPRTLARTLVAVVEGMIVLSKAHSDPKALRDVARGTLALLD